MVMRDLVLRLTVEVYSGRNNW